MSALDCNNCGAVVFEADADGMFYEDDDAVCPDCARICQVAIDGDRAYALDHGRHADVGQPKCDGSCGVLPEYVGEPGDTYWCERCKPAKPTEEPTR